MLPPFVPPSARGSSASLPLITTFVLDRSAESWSEEQGGGAATMVSPPDEQLPSIDEFLLVEARGGDTEPDASQSSATTEDRPLSEAAPPSHAPAAEGLDDAIQSFSETPWIPEPIVNDVVEAAEDWEASASEPPAPRGEQSAVREEAGASSEGWVADERDAFDWQGVSTLGTPADDVGRAADEWSSTEWGRGTSSANEQIAALLLRLARRVRAGEIVLPGAKQMSQEAALASVLAALLGKERERGDS